MESRKPDLTQQTDEELMRLAGKGMEEAFTTLYGRYEQRLFGFFLRMLDNDTAKAEDMLQDIFLKLIAKPEAFDTGRKFSAWIFTVAANMCRNELRAGKHRKNAHQQISLNHIEALPDVSGKRDERVLKLKLQEALAGLDEDARMLFLLRYDQELPFKEIAKVMKVPEGTLRSRLFYLLNTISKKLKAFHQVI